MPCPHYYYCEKCDFSGSSKSAWGSFVYRNGEKEILVNRVVGICYECNKIVPVEKLPNENYLNKLANKRKELLKDRTSKARCLDCSSHDFEVIPNINTNSKDFYSGIPQPTGIKHKNCGGFIYVQKTSTNFFMGDSLSKRYYNVEGLEITDAL